MVDASQVKVGMPLDEFMRLYEQEGPFEIIDGERKPKLPTVARHSNNTRTIFRAVDSHAVAHELGETFSETTFILPDTYDSDWVKGSRTPDVMFFSKEKFAEYKMATPEWEERPYALIPDLVIEVVSPNDQYSEIDAKVDLYLVDGVRVVWVIDPQRYKVHIHTSDSDQPRVLKGEAVLKGGELLPDFEITLKKLFDL